MNKSIIIESPHLQTPGQRIVFGALTLTFWAVWTYLWLPLVSFVAWLFGIHTVHYQMFVLHGYSALADLLLLYALIVAVLGGSLVVWGLINVIRFQNVERRTHAGDVTNDMLADRYAVDSSHLAAWQQSPRLTMHHDDRGRLALVEAPDWSGRHHLRLAPNV